MLKRPALLALVAAMLGGADSLGPLSRRYVETGGAAAREELLRYAEQHSVDPDGPLARLALGIGDYQEKKFLSAAEQLAAASARPIELADYALYYRALALAAAEQHAEAARLLAPFGERYPASPLTRAARARQADSLSLSGRAGEAVDLVASPASASEWLLLARVAERAGLLIRAARACQRVYYKFPLAAEQTEALAALDRLRTRLGARYPEPSADERLGRADELLDARQYRAARAAYKTLALRLDGLPREQAAVRAAACDYHLNANLGAYRALLVLRLSHPEALAERGYYLAACTRRLKRLDEFSRLVADLAEKYPSSPWFEEALLSAGNSFLIENDTERYVRFYRQLLEAFPGGRYAAAVHWKIAWRAYLDRSPEAARLLEDHLRKFPASPQSTAALYWLGRLAEVARDTPRARALYVHLAASYQHYYHALLARERLEKLPAAPGPAPAAVASLLASPAKPAPPPSRRPSPDTESSVRRARLLNRLGLPELAERELRFRADSGPDAWPAAAELAEQAADRGNHHQAVRWLKRYTPSYLAYPIDSMPRRYWELLYPLPWRRQIESYARARDLDPYLVAGLIRQESEFNPGAISSARARGLMQIMLATGRQLGRSVGLTRLTATQLYVPETSLKLGTLHLRRVLDQYEGRLEPALAGYNAGENRADRWLDWNTFSDPAEFVESIPFTETRGYVQAVLRNAALYRKIYETADERR